MNKFRKNLLNIVDKMIEDSRESINQAIYNRNINELNDFVEALRDEIILDRLLQQPDTTFADACSNDAFQDALRIAFEETYDDDSTT